MGYEKQSVDYYWLLFHVNRKKLYKIDIFCNNEKYFLRNP